MMRGYPQRPATARGRAAHRARLKRLAHEFYSRHAIYVVQRMAVARVHREWRVMLLTGPDDRSLTGRLLGDPRYVRSALYFKRMGVAA